MKIRTVKDLTTHSCLLGGAMALCIALLGFFLTYTGRYDIFSEIIHSNKPGDIGYEVASFVFRRVWLVVTLVVALLVFGYLAIEKVLLNYKGMHELFDLDNFSEKRVFPVAWVLYYFSLVGGLMGLYMVMKLNTEVYSYLLWGGGAYLSFAIFAEMDYRDSTMNPVVCFLFALFGFAVFLLYSLGMLLISAALIWIILIVLVVFIFKGGLNAGGSGGKQYKLDDGTRVKERTGLFGDKSYSGSDGSEYTTTDRGQTFTKK